MTNKTPQIVSGISILNNTLNPIIEELFAPAPGASANPLQIWIPMLALVWVAGMVALLTYTIISYVHVRRKIGTALLLHDNIYQSENIASPFVLGLILPKIYLPFHMDEIDVTHVVAHEQAHIRRKDYLWKPLGFLLLTLHWFNPLMWLGYVLLCRDIELACDEKVIKELDRDARADYSQALLTCSVSRPMITACPLAFGEVGVKDRVKSVLNYKKPGFWIVMLAVAACVVLSICYLTNPINKDIMGVNSISVKRTSQDVIDLRVRYSFPTGSYTVRTVPEDEGEYCGDGIRDYDGALGKYRILISFGDTEPSKAFWEKYPAGEVVELENAPIKIRLKRVHTQDHGFSLYVGFDFPVVVESINKGELKTFGGSIKIPITVLSNNLIYGYDTATLLETD
jgi:beta-lactamase regulating signal transducer with metallopeptidase domain